MVSLEFNCLVMAWTGHTLPFVGGREARWPSPQQQATQFERDPAPFTGLLGPFESVHWLPFRISHNTSHMCEGSLLSLHLVIWLLLLLVPSADHGQPIPPLLAAAEV